MKGGEKKTGANISLYTKFAAEVALLYPPQTKFFFISASFWCVPEQNKDFAITT